MKQLDFTLSLIDNLTKPVRQAQASMSNFAKSSQDAFGKIAIGGAGLVGTFFTIKGVLEPAIELQEAVTAATIQGIDEGVMQKIANDAVKFSANYGKSATEFVQSTQLINQSINGLSQAELPKITHAANIMSTALKTTSAESTEFMGQMFAQFSEQANAMGKVAFAEELAGKAVFMSKTFGTSMSQVKDLMEGARSAGTHFGVGMNEQLAVLGELNRTLGTEASSAYESFITNAEKGSQQLGLSFRSASGSLLSLPEMLDKLQGKYGSSIAGNLKAQQEIDAAFGDSAIVIKQLYGNVDVLRKNIDLLGGGDGMKRATEMAENAVSPWDKLAGIWKAMRIEIGMALMPAFNPFINQIAAGGKLLARWLNIFPNITKAIGYITVFALSFAAAGALVNVVMGVHKFIMVGLTAIWKVFGVVIKAVTITFKILRVVVMMVQLAFSPVVLLFTAAIAVVLGLVYGIYQLVTHWEQVKTAVMDTAAFQWVMGVVGQVGDAFAGAFSWIAEGWNNLCALFGGSTIFASFDAIVAGIGDAFSGLWDWLSSSFTETYNWIVEKLNYIPGVNLETKEITKPMTPVMTPTPSIQSEGLLTGGTVKGVPRGGISKEIKESRSSYQDNSKRIDSVTFNLKNPMTPEQLQEWQEVQYG